MTESDTELTQKERLLIKHKQERALQLKLSQVVANDRSDVYVYAPTVKLRRTQVSEGGFIPEEEEECAHSRYTEKGEELSDNEQSLRKPTRFRKRILRPTLHRTQELNQQVIINVPIPPDEEKPKCDLCSRSFDDSFLLKNFEVYVCDSCRDPKGIHSLITKSSAKERYLLSDVDLDIREPKLNYLLKRNPHNPNWGDMRLYLEAQIAERSLEIWGSEEALEQERNRRSQRSEDTKLKKYNKKLKELKVQTRSSLYMKTHKTHEHKFGSEQYDEKTDTYYKSCTECDYRSSFEKL